MPLYAVSVDIGPGDHRPVRSLYTRFYNAARKGRRPDQISLNGSFVLLHTPEKTDALMDRLLTDARLDAQFDRVSIIDLAARRILNWGNFDSHLEKHFPTIAATYQIEPKPP